MITDARNIPISKFYEALDRFERKVENSAPADNLGVAGIMLRLFADGSSSILFSWTNQATGRSESQKILDAVFGAGETSEDFEDPEQLREWFRQQGVWQ